MSPAAEPLPGIQTLGTHYLAALRGAPPARLDDADALVAALVALCARVQLTVLHTAVHRFSPQGVTAVLLLAESHVALHTWPELGQAALDLFSCRAHAPGEVAAAITQLAEALGAEPPAIQTITR